MQLKSASRFRNKFWSQIAQKSIRNPNFTKIYRNIRGRTCVGFNYPPTPSTLLLHNDPAMHPNDGFRGLCVINTAGPLCWQLFFLYHVENEFCSNACALFSCRPHRSSVFTDTQSLMPTGMWSVSPASRVIKVNSSISVLQSWERVASLYSM